jgi:hypothetical protein
MINSKEIVLEAARQVNETIKEGPRISEDMEAPLLDADGGIDSLTLVNLVVAVEQIVFDRTGQSVVVANEAIFSSDENPFRTLDAFSEHLDEVLKR